MPYEFVARNGIIALKDSAITGSLNVSGSLTVGGTITATTLVVQTITSSTSWITGSTKFGSVNTNTHQFTGSVSISGSSTFGLNVNAGALYVNASGDVGVGTSSPNTFGGGGLTLGSTSTGKNLIINSSNAGNNGLIQFIDTAGNSALQIGATTTQVYLYGYSTRYMSFYTNGTEKMVILSNGNVGIGTTAPNSLLNVNGTNPFVRINNTSADNHGIKISYNNSDNHGLHLIYNANNALSYIENTYPVASGLVYGDIYFRQNVGGTMTTRMTIKADGGNVGIGTTNPIAKLVVTGNGTGQGLIGDLFGSGNYTGISLNGSNSAANYNFLSSPTDNALYINRPSGVAIKFREANGSDQLTIATGGNVGINTTSPASKLHVNGTFISNALWTDTSAITYWGNYSTSYGRLTWDTGFAAVYASSGNALYLGSNTTHMVINTSGNVGIGTTSPASKLQVIVPGGLYNASITTQADLTGSVVIQADNSGTNSRASLIMRGSDTIGGAISVAREDTGATWRTYMTFYTNNGSAPVSAIQEKMRINSDGNVGIGVSSPSYKLHVVSVAEGLYVEGANTSPYSQKIAEFKYAGNGNSIYIQNISGQAGFATSTGTNLNFQPAQNSIFHTGNVGIGTTSPSTRLHVSKTDGSNELIAVRIQNNLGYSEFGVQSNYARILANGALLYAGSDGAQYHYYNGSVVMTVGTGNVGIGTTSPGYLLDVYSTTTTTLRIRGGSTGYTQGALLIQSSTTDSPQGRGLGVYTFNEGTDATWFFGNGYSYGDAFIINRKSGSAYDASAAAPAEASNFFIVTNAGNVGIGTAAPTAKLDIRGNTYISGSLSVATTSTAGTGLTVGGSIVLLSFAEIQQGNTFYFYNSGNTSYSSLQQNGNNFLILPSGSGNVGINTSTPTLAKLQVNGNVWATSYTGSFSGSITAPGSSNNVIYNSSGILAGSNTFIFNGTNVGIGTTSPINRLHIVEGTSAVSIGEHSNGAIIWMDGSNGDFVGSDYFSIRVPDETRLSLNYVVTEVLSITSGSLVGIGTTSPGAKLDVNGSAYFGASDQVQIIGTDNGGLNYYAADGTSLVIKTSLYNNPIVFQINSVEKVRISSSGSVGIGTTSPDAIFHVAKSNSGGVGGQIVIDNPAGSALGNTAELSFLTDGGASGAGTRNARILAVNENVGNGAANMQFHTWDGSTSAERMRITYNGLVGIGTTSPAGRLHIKSSGLGTYPLLVQRAANTNNIFYIFEDASGNGVINLETSGGSTGALIHSSGNSYFNGGNVGIGTTSPSSILDTVVSSGGTSGIRFRGYSDAATPYLLSLGTFTYPDQFQIKSVNGLVTMGIVGATGAAPDLAFQTNTTERMRITSGGNVGIGTTAPTKILEIALPNAVHTDSGIAFNSPSGYGGAGLYHDYSAGSPLTNFKLVNTYSDSRINLAQDSYNAGGSPGHIGFFTQASGGGGTATERMRIISTGNVGIGTTSPVQKLQVNGSVALNTVTNGTSRYYTYPDANHAWYYDDDIVGSSADVMTYYQNFLIRYTDTTNVFLINSSGNVGIGTTSPSGKLHIADDSQTALVIGSSTVSYIGETDNGGYPGMKINPYNANIHFGISSTNDTKLNLWHAGANYSYWQQTATYGVISNYSTSALVLQVNGGSVGVGNTAPSYMLDVAQVIRSKYGSNEGGIYLGGTPAGVAYVAGGVKATPSPSYSYTGKLSFYTTTWGVGTDYGITEQMYIDTTAADTKASTLIMLPWGGNVGIGTTSPGGKFDIQTNSSGDVLHRFWNTNTAGTGASAVRIANSGNNNNGSRIEFTDNSYYVATIAGDRTQGLTFRTDATGGSPTGTSIRMIILPGGSVGIGTTSPKTKTDILSLGGTLPTLGTNPSLANLFLNDNGLWGMYFGLEAATGKGYIQQMRNDGATAYPLLLQPVGGNVGIGITSPSYKLHINGGSDTRADVQVTYGALGTTNADGAQFGIQSAGAYIWNFENSAIYFGTNNTRVVDISSAGSVGIGTTAPSSILHIQGSDPFLRINNSSANNQGIKISYNYSDTHGLHLIYNANAATASIDNTYPATSGQVWGDIYFRQNVGGTMTSRMMIKADGGNVGIGTTSPGQKLDVAGYAMAGTSTYRTTIYGDGSGARINFGTPASIASLGQIGTYGSLFNIDSSNGAISFQFGASEKVRITTGGSVGIGTTAPAHRLDVIGNARIGQTSNSSTNAALELTAGGSGYNSYIDFGYYNTFDAAIYFVGYFGADGGQFKIKDAGSGIAYDRMVISGGNITFPSSSVGIGTTSPNATFNIVTPSADTTGDAFIYKGSNGKEFVSINKLGFIRTRASDTNGANMHFFDNGGTKRMEMGVNSTIMGWYSDALASTFLTFQHSSGNIGIGTTAPSYKLHVEGSSYFNGIMGVNGEGNGITVDTGYGNNGRVGFMKYGGLEGMIVAGNTTVLRFGHRTDSDYVATAGAPTIREDIRIQANGSVGIGTTSPGEKLQIAGNTYISGVGNALYFDTDASAKSITQYVTNLYEFHILNGRGNSSRFILGNGSISLGTSSTQMFYINTSNSNVGIGTTSPQARLHIGPLNGDTAAHLYLASNNNSYGWRIDTQDSGAGVVPLRIWRRTAGSDTQVITANNADGNVGIGSTSPAYKLDVSGTIRATADVIAYSDARVKDNITTVENALDKIKSLRGVNYTRKDDETKVLKVGVIAQEVLPILPEVVQQDDQGNYSVAYGNMVGVLIEAIKEQQRQIEDLKYLLSQK